MRIKETFALDRQSETKNYRAKYFIASEGSHSEVDYFDGLNHSVITENVSIVNILRDYASIRNSHPSFIISMIKEFILNVNEQEITVLELKNRILNCIHEYNYQIDIDEIYNKLLVLYKKDDFKIKKEKLNDLFLKLFKNEVYKDLAQNFPVYFESQNVTYSSVTDKINLVIDRDPQNFKDFQYDEVSQFCQKYNVNLYVSNPTFEFWLMLHFSEVEEEDEEKMLNNKYINSQRRYLEKRLHDLCNYRKNALNFKCFEPYVLDAIKREKNYAEDIYELKTKLGSNVGKLIEKMLSEK